VSAAAEQSNFPTMIIPRGTEIRVNNQGQLSIRTPGNLVIQNSGVYSEIESTNGSIRIEENVTVEAVSIRAGQACFIQGTVTAWRVHAKRISLEDRARAYIMLQESEQLELSKGARLVGNFANEKELFLMMGKFTSQLKELPGGVDMHAHGGMAENRPYASIAAPAPAHAGQQRPENTEHLRAAQALIERELARPDVQARDAEALREVLYAIREQNVSRIHSIYRSAFAEIVSPSEPLRQAYDHLEQYFGGR
jgi:cytoskeletal protein CcmA (bactofilin family)